MLRITKGTLTLAILVASSFHGDVAASPPRLVDASFGHVDYIRGYVRWQPVDDAPWQRLTEGERIPMRGRVALGMSAAFVIKIGSTKQTYTTGGIYELATGELSSYVPHDTDTPGIKSMPTPKPKPKVTETVHAQYKPLPDEVTITFVKNVVQWRNSQSDTWTKATVGTKLKVGAQIRTGVRSAITITAADGRSVTLDRLSVVNLKHVWLCNGNIKTDIGMKYGRTTYTVKATVDPFADGEDCANQWSPGATLGIRRPANINDLKFGIPFEHRDRPSPLDVDTNSSEEKNAKEKDAEETEKNHVQNKPLPDEVTITAVKSMVQWRPSDGDRWTKVTVGTKLKMGSQIRTGLRSAVSLLVGEKTIIIDRMGIVNIDESIATYGLSPSKIGIKYGRAKYTVTTAGEEHHSTVHAPSETLAVRGMILVARNVPLSEVVYPSFGPFSAMDTRNMILDNWPGQIDWVMECRRISPVIWERQRTKHRVRQAVDEYEATFLSPPATLAERSQPIDVGLNLNNESLWYRKGVLLSITPTIDELLKSLGLPQFEED